MPKYLYQNHSFLNCFQILSGAAKPGHFIFQEKPAAQPPEESQPKPVTKEDLAKLRAALFRGGDPKAVQEKHEAYEAALKAYEAQLQQEQERVQREQDRLKGGNEAAVHAQTQEKMDKLRQEVQSLRATPEEGERNRARVEAQAALDRGDRYLARYEDTENNVTSLREEVADQNTMTYQLEAALRKGVETNAPNKEELRAAAKEGAAKLKELTANLNDKLNQQEVSVAKAAADGATARAQVWLDSHENHFNKSEVENLKKQVADQKAKVVDLENSAKSASDDAAKTKAFHDLYEGVQVLQGVTATLDSKMNSLGDDERNLRRVNAESTIKKADAWLASHPDHSDAGHIKELVGVLKTKNRETYQDELALAKAQKDNAPEKEDTLATTNVNSMDLETKTDELTSALENSEKEQQ